MFLAGDAVKQQNEQRAAERVTLASCGNRPGSNRKKLPSRKPGARYTSQSYARAITRACEVHGIEHWTPNQLRHGFATEVRKRYGLEASQVLLGHSQVGTTQLYAQRDATKAVEVAQP